MIEYDFDGEIGQDVSSISMSMGFNTQTAVDKSKDYTVYTFAEWANKPRHILDILIFNDTTRFDNILKKFVTEVFNPATLFPRIDELKEFIKPHVIRDKTPDENGKCPGILNENGSDYTLEQWEANSEFTNLDGSYGLKYWILARYRTVCRDYDMECDPVYMDENYEYTIDKSVEGDVNVSWFGGGFGDFDFGGFGAEPLQPQEPQEPQEPQPQEPQEPQEPVEDDTIKCLAQIVGYPCCDESVKDVYDHDAHGDWGYDFDKEEWCGLTPYVKSTECWSEKLGYPCCTTCNVYETDDDGQWGYEKQQWCGIQSYCTQQ